MKKIAVIVAGGSGTRMGTDVPKQFLPLGGRPVLMHTLDRFAAADEIILVLPTNQIARWESLVAQHHYTRVHRVVAGGDSRFASVKNGLTGIAAEAVIAVHDGVRPLVSEKLIGRCFEAAALHGTAIPTISIPDSLRSRGLEGVTPEDRSRFMAVQTPQCFISEHISKAYGSPDRKEFTDDASVLEAAGIDLHYVEGERWNIKITFPEDLKVAEALIG